MTLIHADCFDALPDLPDSSVDLVLADLPYGTTQCAWDTELPLERLWAEYRRVCRGPIILFAQTPFDKVLGASNIRSLKYEWIWEKTNATGHLNAKKAPMKAHENILVFYDKAPTYNPIKTFGHVRKTAVRKTRNESPVYGDQVAGDSYDSTERYPRSVIEFSSDKQRGGLHPTQKPVDLCEYLIRTYTNPGDTILTRTIPVRFVECWARWTRGYMPTSASLSRTVLSGAPPRQCRAQLATVRQNDRSRSHTGERTQRKLAEAPYLRLVRSDTLADAAPRLRRDVREMRSRQERLLACWSPSFTTGRRCAP